MAVPIPVKLGLDPEGQPWVSGRRSEPSTARKGGPLSMSVAQPHRRALGPLAGSLVLAFAAVLSLAPAAQAATAPWLDVEKYYLGLMNCTRTGGWVKADGTCRDRGSGKYSAYRAPLSRHKGISRDVARPYAKVYARNGTTGHYLDGSPLQRFARAGYDPSAWAENMGRWSGDPFQAVLNIHRNYQREKSYNGIHWQNIKKKSLKTAGVGVWRRDGMTYLVVDFYTP